MNENWTIRKLEPPWGPKKDEALQERQVIALEGIAESLAVIAAACRVVSSFEKLEGDEGFTHILYNIQQALEGR